MIAVCIRTFHIRVPWHSPPSGSPPSGSVTAIGSANLQTRANGLSLGARKQRSYSVGPLHSAPLDEQGRPSGGPLNRHAEMWFKSRGGFRTKPAPRCSTSTPCRPLRLGARRSGWREVALSRYRLVSAAPESCEGGRCISISRMNVTRSVSACSSSNRLFGDGRNTAPELRQIEVQCHLTLEWCVRAGSCDFASVVTR